MKNSLFADIEIIPWVKEWQNMPEFSHEDLSPKYQIIINFACASDVENFGKLLEQNIKANKKSKQLQSVWYPKQENVSVKNKCYLEIKNKK